MSRRACGQLAAEPDPREKVVDMRHRLTSAARLALILVLLVGCERTAPTPTPLAQLAATETLTAVAPTAAASVAATPAATDTQAAATATTAAPPQTLSPSATALLPTPFPTAPPPPATATGTPWPTEAKPPASSEYQITGPLIIDSEGGRIYTSGIVMGGSLPGAGQTLVLDARSGALVAAWPITGTLGLDSLRGWLYVDQGNRGLAVVNVGDGTLYATFPFATRLAPSERPPAPQADVLTGEVLAFRKNLVYVINPARGEIARTISFAVPSSPGSCATATQALPVERAAYDPSTRMLYAAFTTYVCTPWIGFTLVSYDLQRDQEIARAGYAGFQMIAGNGRLYGTSFYRLGIGYRWLWRDGKPVFESADWSGGFPAIAYDSRRNLIYEATEAALRVLDGDTLALLMVAPHPAQGQLAGFDRGTDQLYFVVNGRLQPWPLAALRPPTPQPRAPGPLPNLPVQRVVVSPAWEQDHTLFVQLEGGASVGDCFVLGQSGGPLYASYDGGQSWTHIAGGLSGACDRFTALTLSPDYAHDQTLLGGIVGLGVFRSTDGGQLWLPSSAGLLSMGIEQLFVSPAFAQDRTALARARTGGLHRSADGGQTWQPMGADLAPLAMSPEFDQDHTLMGVAYVGADRRPELRVSRDGGATWQTIGPTPEGITLHWLSLAPLYARWQVLFAHGNNGLLYRSADGGTTWTAVLATELAAAELVYAPDIEVNRPLYLVAIARDPSGRATAARGALYRSGDGGQTWENVALAEDISPTAIAISPAFVRDHTLFVGTSDGRVLKITED
mgnify:CR=1 FL=1